MRIIAGKFKGHPIAVPKKFQGRPTTDFAREGLFNMLSSTFNFHGSSVLDLFSGTGAFLLECHSRGAERLTGVELQPMHVKSIIQNLQHFKASKSEVVKADVRQFLQSSTGQYDLIFADPPFDLTWLSELPNLVLASGMLKDSGSLIVEHPKEIQFESHSRFVKHRQYGHVNFSFFS
jgi:16S rRNA (guanine966-N2)-methyltransferase